MKRKKPGAFLAFLLCLTAVILLIAANSSNAGQTIRLDASGDGNFDYEISFDGPPEVVWSRQHSTTNINKYQTEKVYTFKAKNKNKELGTLTLTLRKVLDKDYVFFLKYQHQHPTDGLRAIISAIDGDPLIKGHQIFYGYEISNNYSRWAPFDVTPGYTTPNALPRNAVFLDSSTHHLRLGLVDVFKSLENHVREENIEKSLPISVLKTEKNIDYFIPLPQEKDSFSEVWGILAREPLIDWQNHQAMEDALIGDLVRFRKLSSNGIYYLTPDNYYPTSKTAFWLNPAYHVAELFYKQENGNYFRDIAITSMYTALQSQNTDYYWPSHPRSDWLFEDYGIPEGFYDTRFNTDAALFLLHMYQKYQDEKILEAVKNHASWLRSLVGEQGISTSGGGMLVPDYFKPGISHKKTHVSLNHLVTEMNFLYKLYLVDKNYRDLKTANLIRQAVRDTGQQWIRPDGDLHYAYISDGHYGLQDYPLLTLKDLRLSQKLIRQTGDGINGDEVFQMLIEAKEDYLKKNNLPIW